MAIRTRTWTGIFRAGFINCCGPLEGGSGAALLPMGSQSGTPASSTTGAFRNKYSFLCQNSVRLRSDHLADGMRGSDAYSWYTFDLYIDAMEVDTEWMVASSGHFWSTDEAYCALCFQRAASGGALAKYKAKLVTFNYDALGAPENYDDIADSGAFEFDPQTVHRINIRQRHNSVADTMDIEIWINGVKEIDEAAIAVPGGKRWDHASESWWAVTQFERTAGKGGINFDPYYCNLIWNDESAGVGPTGRPSANYVVAGYQMVADTDDAARDDWTKDAGGGGQPYKHQYVDDNMTDDPGGGDTYVYVGQDTAAEQEFALTDHAQIGGGTAAIDAIAVIGEFRNPIPTGKATHTEAALHCTTGAAWTPDIFDSIFATIKRKTLETGQDLRCFNLYVLALGEDIESPADSPEDDTADQTPSGDLTDYGGSAVPATFDVAIFGGWFMAPPEGEAVTHIRQGVALGSANTMMY